MTVAVAELGSANDLPEHPEHKRERIYASAGWLAVGTTEMADDRPVKASSTEYLKMINAIAAVHGLQRVMGLRGRENGQKKRSLGFGIDTGPVLQ